MIEAVGGILIKFAGNADMRVIAGMLHVLQNPEITSTVLNNGLLMRLNSGRS